MGASKHHLIDQQIEGGQPDQCPTTYGTHESEVHSPKADFVAKGTTDVLVKQVDVENTLSYQTHEWVPSVATHVCAYDLEYAIDGTIDSELAWDSGKPTKAFYKKIVAPLLHRKANKEKLDRIIN